MSDRTEPTTLGDGRYAVERQLGAGGMGAVFLARDTRLNGRLVAVKVLKPSATGALGRFRREAKLMASLRHPGLIDVYDVCLTGPEPYLVQEYVEGSDLDTHLARTGPLPPADALRLARELAATLAYLHGQGVVHRDLKPTNVMVQPDGRFRLADLGLALGDESTRLTREGTLLGTVLYMAPETARGDESGPAADVFAYGLVLWEAATGRHPLSRDSTLQEHLLKLLSGRLRVPEPPPDLPPELVPVLTACLQVEPALRPADGAALVELLGRATPGGGQARTLTSRQRPVSGEAKMGRPSPSTAARRRLPAVAALTLLLLAVVLSGLLRQTPSGTPAPPASSDLQVPSVACLLDGIRLTLPSPPPAGTTATLRTMDGGLVVERPVREDGVTLKAPAGLTGDVRWALRRGGWSAEGVAAVGPRLLFDASAHAPDPSVEDLDVPLPPFVHDDRIVLGLTPGSLFVLRPRREPGQVLTLELGATRSLPRLPAPGRPRGARGVARSRYAAACLAPLGPDTLTAGLFGTPGTFVTVPLDPTPDLVPAAQPGHELVDCLSAPMPGGGSVSAGDVLALAGSSARRRVLLAFSNGPPGRPGRGLTALPGRTPLGLQPLDRDTVLLVHEGHDRMLASLVRTNGTTAVAVESLDLGVHAPDWRDATHPAGLTTSRGWAVLVVADHLVVARPDGTLTHRRLDLGSKGRVGAMAEGPDGTVVMLVCRTQKDLVSSLNEVDVLAQPLTGDPASIDEARRLTLTSENIDDALPLGLLPLADGGFLIWCCGTLYDVGPPPTFARRGSWTVEDRAGWLLERNGSVFVVTSKGRVWAFDLTPP